MDTKRKKITFFSKDLLHSSSGNFPIKIDIDHEKDFQVREGEKEGKGERERGRKGERERERGRRKEGKKERRNEDGR